MACAIARFIRRPAKSLRRGVELVDAQLDRARVGALRAPRRARRAPRSMRSRSPRASRSGSPSTRLASSTCRCARASTRASARRRAARSSSPWSIASISICSTVLVVEAVATASPRPSARCRCAPRARARASRPSASTRNVTSRRAMPGGHRRDALQREAREAPAVGRELALALHDVDLEARLVVLLRRERLRARPRGSSCCAAGCFSTTPPPTSMPSDSGITSSSSTSSALPSPARRSACIAAPSATTWSGIDVRERLLAEQLRDVARARAGTRVEPPTRMTPSSSSGFDPRVAQRAPARDAGALEERLRSSSSKRARVIDERRAAPRRAGSRPRPRARR